MKTQTALITLISMLGAGGLGFALGSGGLRGEPSVVGGASDRGASDELARLRGELEVARRRIVLLEDEARGSGARRVSEGVVTATSAAVLDSAATTAMAQKVAALEAQLAAARIGPAPLTEEQIREKISEARSRFDVAFAAGDGRAATKAMAELSKLGVGAFPDLVKLWARMEKGSWLGLDYMERRGWAGAEVFHWALGVEGLGGLEPALAKQFQTVALFSLRFVEEDPVKRTQSAVSYLSRLSAPAELTEEQKNQRGRGGRGGGMFFPGMGGDADTFRLALGTLAREGSAEGAATLAGIAAKKDYPSDVRVTAVEGLANQKSPEAKRALDDALYDSDPEVKKAAEVAKAQSDAPVAGIFLTSVSSDGEAAKAGVRVGAIVQSYAGVPIRSMMDFMRGMRGGSGPVTLQVYQDGASRSFQVPGGAQLGINGRPVSGPGE